MRERKKEDGEARDRERRDRSVKGRGRESGNKPKSRRRSEERDNSQEEEAQQVRERLGQGLPQGGKEGLAHKATKLLEKYVRTAQRTYSK